jgi:hypothetical protein
MMGEVAVVLNYRACVLARMGAVLEQHDFPAPSDSAALLHARHYLRRQEVEVWQVNRLVGRLKPAGQPE